MRVCYHGMWYCVLACHLDFILISLSLFTVVGSAEETLRCQQHLPPQRPPEHTPTDIPQERQHTLSPHPLVHGSHKISCELTYNILNSSLRRIPTTIVSQHHPSPQHPSNRLTKSPSNPLYLEPVPHLPLSTSYNILIPHLPQLPHHHPSLRKPQDLRRQQGDSETHRIITSTKTSPINVDIDNSDPR